MGCARDIVENVGVPRLWFSNFPLGHAAGKPSDPQSQKDTLSGALALFNSALEPRTTAISAQRWSDDDSWEADFWDISALDDSAIAKLKAQHEQVRRTAANIKSSGD